MGAYHGYWRGRTNRRRTTEQFLKMYTIWRDGTVGRVLYFGVSLYISYTQYWPPHVCAYVHTRTHMLMNTENVPKWTSFRVTHLLFP